MSPLSPLSVVVRFSPGQAEREDVDVDQEHAGVLGRHALDDEAEGAAEADGVAEHDVVEAVVLRGRC